MENWIGDILIDLFPPERPKFKAPLILVHGLWLSSSCWRSWATHFSNLGWECWAVNFRGRFGANAMEELGRLTFSDCVSDLKRVIRAAPFPPVLLAHDLGGLVALKALQDEKASALILVGSLLPADIAPELPRALKLLRLKYRPLLFLRRFFRIEERDFRKNWLNSIPANRHAEPLGCLLPDGHRLIAEFFARRVKLDPDSIRCPIWVGGGDEDRIVPPPATRALAAWLGADFRDYAGRAHWLIGEDGGEAITRDIHRWIVQKAGETLLLEEIEPPPS
jgi:non-heme chloroperoxidase